MKLTITEAKTRTQRIIPNIDLVNVLGQSLVIHRGDRGEEIILSPGTELDIEP